MTEEEDIADFTLDDENVVDTDNGLAKQDLSKINLDDLSVDTFEVMSRQATINVGTIGHVAHGKSTVVKALSGVKTQKFHREAVMNITIHLGYANAKVYQCEACPRPTCYQTYPSSQPDSTPCPNCGATMTLKRHFSFVDCPGHDVLMATMLNGAAIMDAALLLIAANESFPQPQTLEHLAAAEMIGVPSLIVLQNKIDLVTQAHAAAQYNIIHHYLTTKTAYVGAPVIPICAQQHLNLAYLLDYLVHIPLPRRMLRRTPYLNVLRSFDVSLPGPTGRGAGALKGGVVGGTVAAGVLCAGDEIEIIPGLLTLRRRDGVLPRRADVLSGQDVSYVTSPPPGEIYSVPLRTTVVRLQTEQNALAFAVPGGLIAIGTTLDPSLTRQNKLRGQVVRLVRRGPVWTAANGPTTGDKTSSCGRDGDGGGSGRSTDNDDETAQGGGNVDERGARAGAVTAASPLPCPSPTPDAARSSGLTATTARNINGDDAAGVSFVGVQVYQEVEIHFFLLREVIGLPPARVSFDNANSSSSNGWSYRVHPNHTASSSRRRVAPLHEGESIVLNVGTLTTAATVLRTSRHAGRAICRLESPLSADPPQQRIVLARYVDRKVRVIGWGTIRRGVPVRLLPE
ncbi:putative translation initiation factor EIF-2B gamma subunit [Leptomonas pyrrhocoris]|uniref:protein-synthesizing GTPase n=1 Tax=Leptomonas pyrrhocoris TaxID=157538 RepID=A0A0M9FWY2_LEPPY|nr:putative translation initiation factor EIF-2B gamma subunit [Leptomonas pyrrhocoris]XP_015656087.1 putative translation initiation factor EIF-2B gamma subunit [Leptomonas pyrrhocoris]XP_015656088.1 putative translation initiation factor EIF-2B gamma subunit [Leptomonas pyrrhocoris]KPA77647.1 putative translation initiation factor EIF-2B gamma subunit [Leptomonas pyrrhocoris]KPA77648.1 putative translation initiation factor EIF-2B gamma subunit [Leptomonas pyrrhocoris]KPA77649.1 putative tra|eukprot:XP_015656086.1 putative translation initiation factor EIF-2B gamma subunit [Leptomonas pyrrhocoris]